MHGLISAPVTARAASTTAWLSGKPMQPHRLTKQSVDDAQAQTRPGVPKIHDAIVKEPREPPFTQFSVLADV